MPVPCRVESRRQNDRVVIRLAGRLSQAQVPDLLDACATAGTPPRIELDDLISADAVGIDALSRLELLGAELIGLPQYLRLKLDVLARNSKR